MDGEFIRKKIEHSDYQLTEIANKLNISPQALQSKLKAKDIKVSFLTEIAQAINKSVYYFLETKSEENATLLNGGEKGGKKGGAPNVKETPPFDGNTGEIPLFDGVVIAGQKSVADLSPQTYPVDYIQPGDWFRDATAAMRVYEDSMAPEYQSGSIVALREVHDKTLVVYGQDYVIETAEYRVIKRLQRSDQQGHWMLASLNMDIWETGPLKGHLIHEPFDVSMDAVSRLFKVLGYVKRMDSPLLYNEDQRKK